MRIPSSSVSNGTTTTAGPNASSFQIRVDVTDVEALSTMSVGG